MPSVTLKGTLHLRHGVPQSDAEKWLPGDDEPDVVIVVDCEPFVPAKTYGDPDDCYPAEGGGFEVVSIEYDNGLGQEIPSDDLHADVEAYIRTLLEEVE